MKEGAQQASLKGSPFAYPGFSPTFIARNEDQKSAIKIKERFHSQHNIFFMTNSSIYSFPLIFTTALQNKYNDLHFYTKITKA